MELLDGPELRRRLSMRAAIDALERAFRAEDPSGSPLRSNVGTAEGTLLIMPAAGAAGVGVKLVTVTAANAERGEPLIGAVYVLFDARTQQPRAVLDGAALTALRTAAVSGLATRYLARTDAHRLIIFGAGVQAGTHLEAMVCERPIDEVTIVSRSRARAAELRDRAAALGLTAELAGPDAVRAGDVVCTCTSAERPLFDGGWLPEGVHVNAVGSYRPETRELDTEAVRRAKVVVEERSAAFAEAGELAIPLEAGAIEASHVLADLHELVGGVPVRTAPGDVTVFKSVGLAFEDLAVAAAALEAP
ncbi:MAG TPA: ornithine cyclodeaminase family protein [Actinomycetota bacterium]|jgi:ornithine cyclodeaminase